MTRFLAAVARARSTAVVLGAAALVLAPRLARGETIGDENSTLELTLTTPVELPRTLEWTVDGRRILVYPSGPGHLLDVYVHRPHGDGHVDMNQMHTQGTLLGYEGVFGGIVYTVDGGEPGSGASRISEKVDLFNATNAPVSLSLYGMGFRPTREGFAVPDLRGLRIIGTTAVFTQGEDDRPSIIFPIATPPYYAPLTVLPIISFSGFNPLFNHDITLEPGATLTMITELKVGWPSPPVVDLSPFEPLPPPLPPGFPPLEPK